MHTRFDPRSLPSPEARRAQHDTGLPPDTSSPPGTDRGGLGAHTQNEVPPGRIPGHPEAGMGRAIGGPNGLRDAAGTFLYRGGDDYLRGGGGRPLAREDAPRRPRITRSDGRIEEDLNELLTRDPAIDATEIWLECRGGVVSLRGRVEQRWLRYYVEDLVARQPGVVDVDNRLHVGNA